MPRESEAGYTISALVALQMRQVHSMMHTQMVILLALAVAAGNVQPALAPTSTSAYSYTRSSLWRIRHSSGIVQEHVWEDVLKMGYAITGNIHHRQQLHGRHWNRMVPPCPRCRVHGSTPFFTY